MITKTQGWTIQDLTTLPNDGGWTRYEIIHGELHMTRAPHIRHQGVASKLQVRLENWSEATGLGNTFQVPGIVFSPTDAVIPDLVWASRECLAKGLDEAGHCIIAPELIVEILSPGAANQQRDKETKLNLYSRYGVQEYWIVDWQAKTIELYRPSNSPLNNSQLNLITTLQVGDTLTSPLLPGFNAVVAEIFP
jgi:Uma2 family endonuclease